jgi:hypothetical protein
MQGVFDTRIPRRQEDLSHGIIRQFSEFERTLTSGFMKLIANWMRNWERMLNLKKFRSNDYLFQLKIMEIVFRRGIPVIESETEET